MVAFADLLVGLLLVLPGLIAVRTPEPLARLLVRLDALGSRRPPTLEAVDWYVSHVRLSGVAFALIGGVVVFFSLVV